MKSRIGALSQLRIGSLHHLGGGGLAVLGALPAQHLAVGRTGRCWLVLAKGEGVGPGLLV